jgi:ribulose-phosphate 3-epimerase
MEISVSLDPAVGRDLEAYLAEVNTMSGVSYHCDVMRQPFVSRNSCTLAEYEYIINNACHPVDVHFMTDTSVITEVLQGGYKKFPRTVWFHIEAVNDMLAHLYFFVLRNNGIKVGIAIDIDTSPESISPQILKSCDSILVMSVKAGKSGQTFDPKAIEKVRKIKHAAPNAAIVIDGGVKPENIIRLESADAVVVGSYLYNAPDRQYALEKMVLASGRNAFGHLKQ